MFVSAQNPDSNLEEKRTIWTEDNIQIDFTGKKRRICSECGRRFKTIPHLLTIKESTKGGSLRQINSSRLLDNTQKGETFLWQVLRKLFFERPVVGGSEMLHKQFDKEWLF